MVAVVVVVVVAVLVVGVMVVVIVVAVLVVVVLVVVVVVGGMERLLFALQALALASDTPSCILSLCIHLHTLTHLTHSLALTIPQ